MDNATVMMQTPVFSLTSEPKHEAPADPACETCLKFKPLVSGEKNCEDCYVDSLIGIVEQNPPVIKRGRGRPAATDPRNPAEFLAVLRKCKEVYTYVWFTTEYGEYVKCVKSNVISMFARAKAEGGTVRAYVDGDTLFLG